MVALGKLKAIRGWGEMMIPTSEIDRMMESGPLVTLILL